LNCYPNPTNQELFIDYTLKQEVNLKIELFDLTGRSLGAIEDAPNTPGSHSVMFNFGQVISGTYLVRMYANDAVLTRKVILSKS
jgi:hypothetical protein